LPVVAVCFALKKQTTPSIRNGYLYVCAYTAILFALYSAIPYKTPWCSLQMLMGAILSLSLGYALIADILSKAYPNSPNAKLATILIPLALSASAIFGEHLYGIRKMVANPDSKDIPYNYAAASPQVKDMAATISDALLCQTNSFPFVAVAVPTEDTWPLPFYLRSVNGRVGYWTQFEELEALAEIGSACTSLTDCAVSDYRILVGGKLFKPHWATRMELVGGYADLGPHPELGPIREAR